MAADIEMKTRVEAAEFVAAQQIAESELRSISNLMRHALREYMRTRMALMTPDVRASLGTGWDI